MQYLQIIIIALLLLYFKPGTGTMYEFFEKMMFCFDAMFSLMPMKIICLLLGTPDQWFASATLVAIVYLLFIQCMGIS